MSYNVNMKLDDSTNINFEVSEQDSLDMEINEQFVTGITTDYDHLMDKPQINNVELVGNKSFDELGISALTNFELENMLS